MLSEGDRNGQNPAVIDGIRQPPSRSVLETKCFCYLLSGGSTTRSRSALQCASLNGTRACADFRLRHGRLNLNGRSNKIGSGDSLNPGSPQSMSQNRTASTSKAVRNTTGVGTFSDLGCSSKDLSPKRTTNTCCPTKLDIRVLRDTRRTNYDLDDEVYQTTWLIFAPCTEPIRHDHRLCVSSKRHVPHALHSIVPHKPPFSGCDGYLPLKPSISSMAATNNSRRHIHVYTGSRITQGSVLVCDEKSDMKLFGEYLIGAKTALGHRANCSCSPCRVEVYALARLHCSAYSIISTNPPHTHIQGLADTLTRKSAHRRIVR